MTTIGQLPLATSVSDADEIAIFQNGQTLAATRAQMLSGVQTTLSLPQGTVLGNAGPGTSAPIPIHIGANLTLSGSILAANAAPFSIPSLPVGSVPQVGDVVPIGQQGGNYGVSYANFMSGIANVSGIPGGALTAIATGAKTARTLSDLTGNSVSLEDFGAIGDGITDDSGALLAAIASGQPVRLGAKTYAIAGECDLTGTTCSLVGIAGLSVLKRCTQSKIGAASTPTWLNVECTNFFADGITFDANNGITSNTLAVAIQSSCVRSLVTRCIFQNAKGSSYGNGLTYLASDPALTNHHIDDCEFVGNSASGFMSFATYGLSVTNCRSHDNGLNGIYVDSTDTTFKLKVRALHVANNVCWNNNNVGILVGNFISNNVLSVPYQYGNSNPDILGAVIIGNNCYQNGVYGVYISGRNILVSANICTNNSTRVSFGAGILCDTGYCKITGNMVTGATAFGIDCGGSIYTEVENNYINGAITGLNIGGGLYCIARSNFIQDCTGAGIGVQNVESDGAGDNFGLACTGLSIIGNWINYSGSVIGILIRDAVKNVRVEDNVILANAGANLATALSAYTDSMISRRNILNYTTRWAINPAMVGGIYTLTVPDIADAVSISQSSAPISSIVTTQGAAAAGQITFIKITSAGTGYTKANISISGTGSGAAASAWISGGKIIGIQMSAFGSGYGAGTIVTISGDGAGAVATPQVGLPVLSGKELTIDCLTPVVFATAGASPDQINWTGAPITIPAGACIDWIGASTTSWRAERFVQNDYILPNGDGSLSVRSQSGDISLHPSGSGVVRLISDTEPMGAVELIGRGSPLNTLTAPAGSTYRNLNGGVGSTFWVKQSGNGTSNWVAIA
ncbi:right-handed parallel beta-helix repeat-containing protein [Acidocella sp.]|uniref:right-handed parallel beta-helix repeat-containing protein n=1 Tax=Acidocella sp. TaxID=50710 RepID=UPI00262302AE|nr:right-handed parallel beta-helix repeat-containing protein [Acidocella sp.]